MAMVGIIANNKCQSLLTNLKGKNFLENI